MGKHVVTTTTYISDLTGDEVFTDLVTITGTVEGERFKLEVTPEEAKAYRDATSPYVEASRRMKGQNAESPTHVSTDAKTMRISLNAWGYEGVPSKGRLAPEWVERYNAEVAERAKSETESADA